MSNGAVGSASPRAAEEKWPAPRSLATKAFVVVGPLKEGVYPSEGEEVKNKLVMPFDLIYGTP